MSSTLSIAIISETVRVTNITVPAFVLVRTTTIGFRVTPGRSPSIIRQGLSIPWIKGSYYRRTVSSIFVVVFSRNFVRALSMATWTRQKRLPLATR